MNLIGSNIRKARKNKKLTLKALASRTNISVSFLSSIERGERTANLNTLKSIAEVLDVPIYQLTGEKPRELSENSYLKKGNLAELIKLRNMVKKQPALFLDGKEISKNARTFVEDILDKIIERELKKQQKNFD